MANRPRVFLDINVGASPAGRLVIELFTDKTPKTCENFRQLCTGQHNGLSYAKSPFHRIIDGFMVQGGDIVNGDGTGVASIYGKEFEDENLDWRDMSASGLVCSANRGHDTNGSQFFVLLEPEPHLNGKHTVFGSLVSGEEVLSQISKVEVDENDRPVVPVLVSRSGELERKKKAQSTIPSVRVETSTSGGRGRRRKSNGSDSEMSDAPAPPRQTRKARRQSDNVVDEGLRGRPRKRSALRADSQPIEEDDQSSAVDSPVKMHKRKRSPSPGRNLKPDNSQSDDQNGERRRRSLPNQYKGDRDYAEGDRYRPSPRRDDYKHYSRRGDERHAHGRENDRFRAKERDYQRSDSLRLGNDYEGFDPPVKFKGRGAMKYREPDRC